MTMKKSQRSKRTMEKGSTKRKAQQHHQPSVTGGNRFVREKEVDVEQSPAGEERSPLLPIDEERSLQ